MLPTYCSRWLRKIALLLICFVVVTPLAGGPIFISAALERGEFYAGVVLNESGAPPVSRAVEHLRHTATKLGEFKVSSFNLFLHLHGIFVPAVSTDWLAKPGGGRLASAIPGLPMWELVFEIFEPPKARVLLP